jgi:LuxR family transcriptional regulator, quorum-sensing system regulator BjaR1
MRRAFAFIEDLDCANGITAVIAAMDRTLASYGFEFFCFHDFPDPERFADFIFCKRFSDEWLKLYIKEGYARIDPALRMCRRTTKPFIWADAPYDPEREPRTLEFVRRVADFGLARGLMVPIPRNAGRPGVVWFGGSNPELDVHTLPVLHCLALYAFEKLRQISRPAYEEKPLLTPREREVLAWAAEGKTAWQIGEILAISKRTVDEHVRAAVVKLGATNRTHAVVLAIRDHLVEL